MAASGDQQSAGPLTPEQWRRTKELFEAALGHEPGERPAFLDAACGDEPWLRREVESLLASHNDAKSFMESTADASATTMGSHSRSTLSVNERIGHYQVLKRIGAGGMGEVYLGEDLELKRKVAIKVIPAELSNPDRVNRLKREARAAGTLNHPNVCTIYEVGEADSGTAFIAMEYIEGTPLSARISGHPCSPAEIVKIAIPLADALREAHSKGILHRDIKSANIMITSRGQPKLLDFGLAKPLSADFEKDSALGLSTASGLIMGTLDYMSPEQLSGEELDARSDLFSFGIVLYQMATGQHPFKGKTAGDTVSNILHSQPPLIPRLNPGVLPELCPVIARCLEKDRNTRFQSAEELLVDLERMTTAESPSILGQFAPSKSLLRRWQLYAGGVFVLSIFAALGTWHWRARPAAPPAPADYAPLTNFADSAVQPAVSPDGRMLAFIRGDATFGGRGEIYVKLLPDGQPVQLTRDDRPKMSPAFSPDGTLLTYTATDRTAIWDTWTVPALGGEAHKLLPNAASLSWINRNEVLYSEIKKGIWMGVTTSQLSRSLARDIYLPPDTESGMAHRSSFSPDGKWVLISAEMDASGWLPCRVVPFDGSSRGRTVGLPAAPCSTGAWSKDGKWIYLAIDKGTGFHLWRQRFPEGIPEQITSGATEEEGIAVWPDGQSLVTSVGRSQSTIWLHDVHGERQVSSEGYAFLPSFSSDGKKLFYLLRTAHPQSFVSGELWELNLASGGKNRLLPEFLISSYSISPHGRDIVFAALDNDGKSHLWVGPMDRSSPPKQISSSDEYEAFFTSSGEILFQGTEDNAKFVFRIKPDGSGREKVLSTSVLHLISASPDGQWVVVWVADKDKQAATSVMAYPVAGGQPFRICTRCIGGGGPARDSAPIVSWSPDGAFFYFALKGWHDTYAVTLHPASSLPSLPASGIESEADVAKLPGARMLSNINVSPSPNPAIYAFTRVVAQRNLYRVQIP